MTKCGHQSRSTKIEDSPGEKNYFDRLRNNIECEDWYVFYSFFLDDHQSQQEGEIDFLVFIPKKGFVVVEVKSHLNMNIKTANGIWEEL